MWWEKPVRIADFGMTEFSLEKLETSVKRKKELSFNAEHLGIFDANGGDRGIFYFKSSVADKVPADFLGPYLDMAHHAGIKVLIYFNVHWLHADFAGKHHDWLQLKRDGAAIDDVYGRGMSPCVNSPGYRAYSFQAIRDLARYPIDGVFLDGPIFISSGCFCAACREKFRTSCQAELPSKEDWEDFTWKKFIEFRYDSITDYMRDSRAALKEVRPEAIIYMNGQGLWPSWPNGRDNRRLAAHQDIVGAEGGFLGGVLGQVPLWKPAMSAKLLETQAAGKPTVIFTAGHHCGFDRCTIPPAETALLYAGTIAHGASPWYGLYYDDTGTAGPSSTGELNRFIRANEQYLGGTTSVANVALMWSVRTADYYRATVPVTDFTQDGEKLTKQIKAGDHYKAFSGYFEALTRSHVPFDVLDEQGVEEKLDRYACLVLPNAACMSDRLAGIVAAWVRKGGILVSSFETSFYDEWGVKRASPALAELAGIRPVADRRPVRARFLRSRRRGSLRRDRPELHPFPAVQDALRDHHRHRARVLPRTAAGPVPAAAPPLEAPGDRREPGGSGSVDLLRRQPRGSIPRVPLRRARAADGCPDPPMGRAAGADRRTGHDRGESQVPAEKEASHGASHQLYG